MSASVADTALNHHSLTQGGEGREGGRGKAGWGVGKAGWGRKGE